MNVAPQGPLPQGPLPQGTLPQGTPGADPAAATGFAALLAMASTETLPSAPGATAPGSAVPGATVPNSTVPGATAKARSHGQTGASPDKPEEGLDSGAPQDPSPDRILAGALAQVPLHLCDVPCAPMAAARADTRVMPATPGSDAGSSAGAAVRPEVPEAAVFAKAQGQRLTAAPTEQGKDGMRWQTSAVASTGPKPTAGVADLGPRSAATVADMGLKSMAATRLPSGTPLPGSAAATEAAPGPSAARVTVPAVNARALDPQRAVAPATAPTPATVTPKDASASPLSPAHGTASTAGTAGTSGTSGTSGTAGAPSAAARTAATVEITPAGSLRRQVPSGPAVKSAPGASQPATASEPAATPGDPRGSDRGAAVVTAAAVAHPSPGAGARDRAAVAPSPADPSVAADDGVRARLHDAAEASANRLTLRQAAHGELDVPELGRVTVSARSRDGEVDLRVRAERPETAHTLAAHAGEISAAVRAVDVPVGRLTFEAGAGGGGHDGAAAQDGSSSGEGRGGSPDATGEGGGARAGAGAGNTVQGSAGRRVRIVL